VQDAAARPWWPCSPRRRSPARRPGREGGECDRPRWERTPQQQDHCRMVAIWSLRPGFRGFGDHSPKIAIWAW